MLLSFAACLGGGKPWGVEWGKGMEPTPIDSVSFPHYVFCLNVGWTFEGKWWLYLHSVESQIKYKGHHSKFIYFFLLTPCINSQIHWTSNIPILFIPFRSILIHFFLSKKTLAFPPRQWILSQIATPPKRTWWRMWSWVQDSLVACLT